MSFKPIPIVAASCTGCRACEAACVFFHDNALGTSSARVRIHKEEAEGLDEPRLCRLCDEPACVPSCPVGALRQDPERGTIIIEGDLCTSCGACTEACPFGSVGTDPRDGRPLFCDLCGGRTACVSRCSPGALQFEAAPRRPR